MGLSKGLLTGGAGAVLGALLALGGLYYVQTYRAPSDGGDSPPAGEAGHAHVHAETERVKISPQARASLRLDVQPIRPQSYRRTITVPAVIAERRGQGDRGFVAPVAGVVQTIHALPGEVVEPGAALVTLRVVSEPLQASQTELYKAAQESRIVEDQKKRLEAAAQGGAVATARILELQYQLDRSNAIRKAHRADLSAKGLTSEQIDRAEQGLFLREQIIRVPSVPRSAPPTAGSAASKAAPLLEVEDLTVRPGEQVSAGQPLGHLSRHSSLYAEGRAFREDTPLLERAADRGWPLEATFIEEQEGHWPTLEKPLTILYLANVIDPESQTFPFYVPLPNQHREYTRAGRTFRLWRFRPGQRVQLGVPVEEYTDVFVLPADAIARAGAEAYVFRQNGAYFERRPVRVLHEDSRRVVLANDGSIAPGAYVAQHGAEALHRVLQAQAGSAGGHGHDHGHGHSHEH